MWCHSAGGFLDELHRTFSIYEDASMFFKFHVLLCVCLCVCIMYVCVHACHSAYAEVREHIYGVGSLLPPLGGFQESAQAFGASCAFTF